jgi:hypothetical protein
VAACQIALAAAVVVSIARRRSAWRAWAFLAVAFLLNAVVYLSRSTGAEHRVLAALLRGPGLRGRDRHPLCLRSTGELSLPRPGGGPGESGAAGDAGPFALAAAGVAVYVGLVAASDASIADEVPAAKASRHWVGTSSAAYATGRPEASGRCCSTVTRP